MMINAVFIAKAEEIIEQGKFLYQTYSLWLQIVDPRENKKYAEHIESNNVFFGVISNSLFSSVVSTIANLSDKNRDDVLSIFAVLNEVEQLHPELKGSIISKLEPYEPDIEALIQIRHKIYAHRDRNICPELVFRAADITPEQIHSCVSILIDVIDEICSVLGIRAKHEALMEILDTSLEIEDSFARTLR